MRRECDRSADVAAAAIGGDLLREADEDLQRHVAECESCHDLVLVMSALRAERDAARRAAVVPSAGLVWWRAQLRQRQEAARKAAAPVTLVHAASLAAVLAFAAFLVWTAAGRLFVPGPDLGLPSLSTLASASAAVTASPAWRYGLIAGVTTWLILGPVALYLALRREP